MGAKRCKRAFTSKRPRCSWSQPGDCPLQGAKCGKCIRPPSHGVTAHTIVVFKRSSVNGFAISFSEQFSNTQQGSNGFLCRLGPFRFILVDEVVQLSSRDASQPNILHRTGCSIRFSPQGPRQSPH